MTFQVWVSETYSHQTTDLGSALDFIREMASGGVGSSLRVYPAEAPGETTSYEVTAPGGSHEGTVGT